MYNPKKDEVHYEQLWSIIDTIGQRFLDVDKKVILNLIEMIASGEKIEDFERKYNELTDEIYRTKIRELIEDLERCVEK